MTTTSKARFGIVSLLVLMATIPLSRAQSEEALQARYTGMLEKLRTELKAELGTAQNEAMAPNVIKSAKADEKLVRFVVLNEALPAGLAAWANGDKNRVRLIEALLGDTDLMKQMLVADILWTIHLACIRYSDDRPSQPWSCGIGALDP